MVLLSNKIMNTVTDGHNGRLSTNYSSFVTTGVNVCNTTNKS